MSVVNTETGEIVEYDRAAAERRAERIRLRLDSIADSYTAVMPMIREAIEKRDDLALGYRSVSEYVSDRFGGALTRLGVEVRREVVRELTEAGMSKRAIAPVVGVTHQQVTKDRAAASGGNRVATSLSPAPTPEGEAEIGTGHTPQGEAPPAEPVEEVQPERAKPRPAVTGIDGKTYTRPEPKAKPTKPRKKPFLDDLAGVIHDLTTSTEKLSALLTDDRFTSNAQQAATENRDDLLRIISALQSAANQLP